MRNMWSCPDTQSEETQSLTPSFSPPFSFSLPPFLPFFLAHSRSPRSPHFRSSLAFYTAAKLLFCSSVSCTCQIFSTFFFSAVLWKPPLQTISPVVPEQVTHCQQEKYTGLVCTWYIPPYTAPRSLVLALVAYTYCWVMQCNMLARKRGKKEAFLRPSSLTGSPWASFMCWIHPYHPPGSINCVLQWSSVSQCGTSAHLVDGGLSRGKLRLWFCRLSIVSWAL